MTLGTYSFSLVAPLYSAYLEVKAKGKLCVSADMMMPIASERRDAHGVNPTGAYRLFLQNTVHFPKYKSRYPFHYSLAEIVRLCPIHKIV
jgi:hypothetical protein